MTRKTRILLIGAGSALALILIAVIWFFASLSSTKTTGVKYETDLSAQYAANRVYLSGYINGFGEQTGLAKVKSDKLNEILIGAVTGRYDDEKAEGPFGGDSQFAVNVIREAYPNLSQLDIYDKIAQYVRDQRNGYVEKQTKLRAMLSQYDAWRNKGLVHPMVVDMLGFPRDTAEAQANGQTLRGQAAIDQMKRLVEAQGAADTYDTGIDKPVTVEPR